MVAPADAQSAAQPPAAVAAEPPINLGQFVKLAGLAGTGGEAKHLVISGSVRVNAMVETRRGRKLALGDIVESRGVAVQLVAAGPSPAMLPPTSRK
jgi:ribosome-associated protein